MKLRFAGAIVFSWILVHGMSSHAQQEGVATGQATGAFEATVDVGQPKIAGSTAYDSKSQHYTMTGAGSNMWFDRDEHQFAYERIRGDFIVQAEGKFISAGGVPHRKFGIIARASLEPNSPQVNVVVHGDGRISLQWRPTAGFRMTEDQEIVLTQEGADFFQLERKGSTCIASVAKFGDLLKTDKVADIDLGENPYVGLFVCSHDENQSHQVEFRNVRIVIPVKDNFTPYRDYIGSNMELLDPASGERELVYHSPDNFEAPNWTPDGKALIYNGRGKLFRIDLASRNSSPISTGSATQLNNDHVLSPDGKVTGISHRAGSDQSVISVLPIEGGEPRRVTEKSPSYLHGWSPDGKYLVYTAQREGDFNIYRVPAEGGEETRLTDAKGLDDGPEYTPDAQYIYFNSARTGRMQLWRMKPDGTQQTQITDDDLNNWFAHPSPDGKWIAFLSYLPEVSATDHPYYKQVYLRLMPADGGEKPKVIAYVYGGQGTINVPSWSPDSKKLAFVSNTAGD